IRPPPRPDVARLPETVEFTIDRSALFSIPPPRPFEAAGPAVLSLIVLLSILSICPFVIPPPHWSAWLLLTKLSTINRSPVLKMPPPWWLDRLARICVESRTSVPSFLTPPPSCVPIIELLLILQLFNLTCAPPWTQMAPPGPSGAPFVMWRYV